MMTSGTWSTGRGDSRGELKTFSEMQVIEARKKKEQALLKSKQAKMKILEIKKKREVEKRKKPKTLLNAQGSHERIRNLKNNYKTMSLKKQKKKKKGLGVKVIKAEMNSVSKRADYLCRVSIFQTTKSTKVRTNVSRVIQFRGQFTGKRISSSTSTRFSRKTKDTLSQIRTRLRKFWKKRMGRKTRKKKTKKTVTLWQSQLWGKCKSKCPSKWNRYFKNFRKSNTSSFTSTFTSITIREKKSSCAAQRSVWAKSWRKRTGFCSTCWSTTRNWGNWK